MNLYCTGHFPAPQKNTYKVKKRKSIFIQQGDFYDFHGNFDCQDHGKSILVFCTIVIHTLIKEMERLARGETVCSRWKRKCTINQNNKKKLYTRDGRNLELKKYFQHMVGTIIIYLMKTIKPMIKFQSYLCEHFNKIFKSDKHE